MSYISLDTIGRPVQNATVDPRWGDQVDDNFTYLYNTLGTVNSQVSTNTSSISTLNSQVATLQSQQSSTASAVSSLQTNVQTNTTAISALQTSTASASCWVTSTTTAIPVAANTEVPVPFNSAQYDPAGMLNTSTGVITIKTAGNYIILGQASFSDGSAGPTGGPSGVEISTLIRRNGVDTTLGGRDSSEGVLSTTRASGIIHCAVNDTIVLVVAAFLGSGTTYLYGPNCNLAVARIL